MSRGKAIRITKFTWAAAFVLLVRPAGLSARSGLSRFVQAPDSAAQSIESEGRDEMQNNFEQAGREQKLRDREEEKREREQARREREQEKRERGQDRLDHLEELYDDGREALDD